jgi:hypothetical protein
MMVSIELSSCSNTTSLGTVMFFTAGLMLSSSAISNMEGINYNNINYELELLRVRTLLDNTGGAVLPVSNEDFSIYEDIKNFAVTFVSNMKDTPSEFNKTFRKNFRRLLA